MSGDASLENQLSAAMDIGDYFFSAFFYGGALYSLFVGLYFFVGRKEGLSSGKSWSISIGSILIAVLHWMLFFLDEKYLQRSAAQHLKGVWFWLHLAPVLLLCFGLPSYFGSIKKMVMIGLLAVFWVFSLGFGYLFIYGK